MRNIYMNLGLYVNLSTDKSEYYYSEFGIFRYFENNVNDETISKECSKYSLYY